MWIAIKLGQQESDSHNIIKLESLKFIPEMSKWFSKSVSSKKDFIS